MSHVIIACGSDDDHRELRCKRLLFRCWHRGTHEIDLIFGSFAESAADRLSTAQLGQFEAPPEMLRDLDGLEVNRINQLVVEPTLQTTRDPDIFAIGDCAVCPQAGGPGPVPPRAQAAHEEAAHMLRQIERRQRSETLQPFRYRDFGSLVSLGRYSTVGSLMGFLFGRGLFIEGLFARLMYHGLRTAHERALNGSLNAIMALLARALSRRTGPVVKLH